jgi:uncharacterized peroxidase-related enzyme
LLADPPLQEGSEELFANDLTDPGYVMNLTRLWAYQPQTKLGLFELIKATTKAGELTMRQRGILVSATASTLGDSYCSIAWGKKLANEADPEIAAAVLLGRDDELTESEKALAIWARKMARDANSIDSEDIERMRKVGFSDEQIFAITAYVAFRIAFSTVNDALGALPDAEFRTTAPSQVLAAVTWGREIGD